MRFNYIMIKDTMIISVILWYKLEKDHIMIETRRFKNVIFFQTSFVLSRKII